MNIDSLIRRRFYKYRKMLQLQEWDVTLKIRDRRFREVARIDIFEKKTASSEINYASAPISPFGAVVNISRSEATKMYKLCPLCLNYVILHELLHYRLFLDGKDVRLPDLVLEEAVARLKKELAAAGSG